jgi:ribulose-phosphate 3-epimerase
LRRITMVMDKEKRERLSKMVTAPYAALSTMLICQSRKVGGNQYRHQECTKAILIDYGYVESLLLKAALCHDLLEDLEDFDHNLLINADEEGPDVYKLVLEVTRQPGEEKSDFLSRINAEGSREAKLLKVCDRISNMTDIGIGTDQSFIKRYCDETEEYILPMAHAVDKDMVTELTDLIKSRRAYLAGLGTDSSLQEGSQEHIIQPMQKTIIAPSVLAADFSNLAAAVADIDRSGAEWVHFDIMDNKFVPNHSFGPKLVKDLKDKSRAIFDVHLMVYEPERMVEECISAGADYITFHVEAVIHSLRLLTDIRKKGKKAGISIVPSTPVSSIKELLPFTDLVLVMTVNPGFGGQELIPQCLEKVKTLAELRRQKGLDYRISVDGGINESTAALAREAGADVMVTGCAFFNAEDKTAMVRCLKGDT